MVEVLRSVRSKLHGLLHSLSNDGVPPDSAAVTQRQTAVENEMHEHAFESVAFDRDRLAKELETYKHAFETTSADRDRLEALAGRLADKHDRLLSGLVAHVFRHDLDVAPASIGRRLLAAKGVLNLQSRLQQTDDPETLARAAAGGLLDFAEVVLRVANISEQGLDFVELSRALDPIFPNQRHATDVYFNKRKSVAEHDRLYADAVRDGYWPDEGTRTAQTAAIERGLPSVLLITLPKSGSIFIWKTIASSLQLPMLRVAPWAQMMKEIVVPSLLEVFAEGGMTAQHHLAPSKSNIEALKNAQIKKFVLHFRDPRQAAVSWWYYSPRIGVSRDRERSQQETEDHVWRGYLEPAAEWLHGWLEVDEKDSEFEIVLSTHEEMAGQESAHISNLLRQLDVPLDSFNLQLSDRSGETHFRKGAKDEWLDFFSEDFKQRSTKLIPNSLARRFGWNEIH